MGVKLYQDLKLENPDMIACWSGIGNIGLNAVDTLRRQIGAEELGEIEPWDFFYPRKAIIRAGVLEDLEFPRNMFYYKRLGKKDLIIFIARRQPTDGRGRHAEGKKAYQMAGLILDVAEKFGCQRIYTSGAAVALTHHTLKPRVWAVTSQEELIKEVKSYQNTILMGEVEGGSDRGSIAGLNGLLLGLAKRRGFEAVCLMGEIPDYLSRVPFSYPKASKSVLEVFSSILGIEIDYGSLDEMTIRIDGFVDDIYQKFPSEIRERIEQRKSVVQPKPEMITEDDEEWIKEHIDELFNKGDAGDE